MGVSVDQPWNDDLASAVNLPGASRQSVWVWTLSNGGDSVAFNANISIPNDLPPLIDGNYRRSVKEIALRGRRGVRHVDCRLHHK
jgi:hypothetical protein